MKHQVVWHTASPLWAEALKDSTTLRFRRPALLRFAADTFMDDVQATLEADPAGLRDVVARPETWRDPAAGWLPEAAANGTPAFDPALALKLYQPAHLRFYLVAASLVCQVRGLPDKTVATAQEETTSFVLRRLVPGAAREYGWFGAQGWKAVNENEAVDRQENGTLHKEERLPLFPLSFGENGRKRRLLAGLVPVANRENYEAARRSDAPPPAPPADDALADARLNLFEAVVVQALAGLCNALLDVDTEVSAADARDVLLFALLDLAEFLEAHLPQTWAATVAGQWQGGSATQQAVFNNLDLGAVRPVKNKTWRQALADYATGENAKKLREGKTAEVLTLAEGELNGLRTGIQGLGVKEGGAFHTNVAAALAALPPADPGAVPGTPPVLDASAGASYVVRCVYERPQCRPYNTPPVVSAPSQPFQLASFFDPDAPARPLRITLPVDTSVGGFRKAAKGVSVLFSKQLREQMDRIQDANFGKLDEGEISEGGGLSIGMICSFSIPIITICAMILLMIIVQLLNIVFWWLPFFRICFPVPIIESEG